MNSGEIDRRTLVLDAEWNSPEDSEPSEDEDEDEEMIDFYGNDGDDEDEEEDEEESDNGEGEEDDEGEQEEDEPEIEPSPPPPKRKRPAEPSKGSIAPPKKRVAFDLQKPAKVGGLPSKFTPPRSNLKKSTLVPKKRR